MERPRDNTVVPLFPDKLLAVNGNQSGSLATDQRMHTRYQLNAKAKVTTESGECIWCQLQDISRSGLQLSGSANALKTLLPHYQRQNWKTPVAFDVEFSVPTSQCLDAPVCLQCAVIYCRRVKTDEFSIGAQFKSFSEGTSHILEDFLTQVAELQ